MFKTQPQHDFIYKSSDYLNGLFENCSAMKDFKRNINKLAKSWKKLGYDENKFKGDAFEHFIELLLMLHPNDSRLGLYDYKPNSPENDFGVDGTAKNFKGEECVIQIKFRSSSKRLTVTDDRLTNLVSSGMIHHNVIIDTDDPKNYRHFVFTNAPGLSHYTDNQMLSSRVKCFGHNDMKKLVDNNKPFWDMCREISNNQTKERNDA
jgi:hypothetical protein